MAFAEPQLHANIEADMEGNLYFVVAPNDEVVNLVLWTPMDPGIQVKDTEMVIILKIPDQLPLWPELVFVVNGNEIYKTNRMELKDIWDEMSGKKTLR